MHKTPIKRHIALQAVSREHHHTLLFCWKINEGLRKDVATNRIKMYVDWFWTNFIQTHFTYEEQFILPLLDNNHHLYQQTLNDHHTIKVLCTTNTTNEKEQLVQIATTVTEHIRFEERNLFAYIQEQVDEVKLNQLLNNEPHVVVDNWEDEFWR